MVPANWSCGWFKNFRQIHIWHKGGWLQWCNQFPQQKPSNPLPQSMHLDWKNMNPTALSCEGSWDQLQYTHFLSQVADNQTSSSFQRQMQTRCGPLVQIWHSATPVHKTAQQTFPTWCVETWTTKTNQARQQFWWQCCHPKSGWPINCEHDTIQCDQRHNEWIKSNGVQFLQMTGGKQRPSTTVQQPWNCTICEYDWVPHRIHGNNWTCPVSNCTKSAEQHNATISTNTNPAIQPKRASSDQATSCVWSANTIPQQFGDWQSHATTSSLCKYSPTVVGTGTNMRVNTTIPTANEKEWQSVKKCAHQTKSTKLSGSTMKIPLAKQLIFNRKAPCPPPLLPPLLPGLPPTHVRKEVTKSWANVEEEDEEMTGISHDLQVECPLTNNCMQKMCQRKFPETHAC